VLSGLALSKIHIDIFVWGGCVLVFKYLQRVLIMNLYTSEQILKYSEDHDDFFMFDDDFSLMGGLKYTLTEAENQWLEFVRGRYCIADYIIDNTDDNGVTTFDSDEFSKALDNDCGGCGKAVCLSDDTALQMIFFYGYRESEENTE